MAVVTESPRSPVLARDPLTASWYDPWKRGLETVFAAALLLTLLPLLMILALLIKLTSPGPVLYSQVRLGRGGRRFRIYKLRSMRHDCERRSGACWSLPGDRRVTRLGRYLRSTHLDELPQLWNVICGDMSLVGPRPERPEIAAALEQSIPLYRERLQTRPGVTGLAQLQLPPDTDLESVRRKVSYDLCYIRQRGPWMDLRIVSCTALQMMMIPYQVLRELLMPRVNPGDVSAVAGPLRPPAHAGMEVVR